MQQRKRKPIAPATVESWQGALDVWILPNLGDVPSSSVGNLALKGLVEKMVKAGLSPKTVNTYSQVVKSVVASAVNEEGEQLFPRKWNHEFVDMPVVDKSKQNTPHFTSEVIARDSRVLQRVQADVLCLTWWKRDSALEKHWGLKSTSTSRRTSEHSTFARRSAEES